MGKQGTHILIHPDLTPKLELFSLNRKRPKTKIINAALRQYFELEYSDAAQHFALREAIDRRFSVPAAIPHRSFFMFLYMLAEKYGESSSREFWTEVIYRPSVSRTHKEIFDEIQSDYKLLLNGHGKKD